MELLQLHLPSHLPTSACMKCQSKSKAPFQLKKKIENTKAVVRPQSRCASRPWSHPTASRRQYGNPAAAANPFSQHHAPHSSKCVYKYMIAPKVGHRDWRLKAALRNLERVMGLLSSIGCSFSVRPYVYRLYTCFRIFRCRAKPKYGAVPHPESVVYYQALQCSNPFSVPAKA